GRGGERRWFPPENLSEPAELWSLAGDKAQAHTKFTEPALRDVALGEVQEIEIEGARGAPVQAYVILPPGFDASKTWPLVHVIHGGPHAISGDLFHPRWSAHLFAAPGYVVATVNFHGSTSWGQDFAQCI